MLSQKRKAGEEPQARAPPLLLRARCSGCLPPPLRVLPPAVTSAPVLSALRRALLPQAAGAGTKKEVRTLLTEQDVSPSLKGACCRCVGCACMLPLLPLRSHSCLHAHAARPLAIRAPTLSHMPQRLLPRVHHC